MFCFFDFAGTEGSVEWGGGAAVLEPGVRALSTKAPITLSASGAAIVSLPPLGERLATSEIDNYSFAAVHGRLRVDESRKLRCSHALWRLCLDYAPIWSI